MAEAWKPVFGFEGVYEVSDRGRVRRLDGLDARGHKWKGRVLRQTLNVHGRPTVSLSSGDIVRAPVHRLVCEAFHGPRPVGLHAAHYDGDVRNNRADNLRWATAAENEADKVRHGTVPRGDRNGKHTKPERTPRGAAAGQSRLTVRDIKHIRSAADSGAMGCRRLARQYGVSATTIKQIVNRRTWSHV